MTEITGILEQVEPELKELADSIAEENPGSDMVERLMYQNQPQPVLFVHGEDYYSVDLPESEEFELHPGRPLKGEKEPDQEAKQRLVEEGSVESMNFWEERQDPAQVAFSKKGDSQ